MSSGKTITLKLGDKEEVVNLNACSIDDLKSLSRRAKELFGLPDEPRLLSQKFEALKKLEDVKNLENVDDNKCIVVVFPKGEKGESVPTVPRH